MYYKQSVKIKTKDGQDHVIELWRINHDVNGNPRYVIHYLALDQDYDKALRKVRCIGGKVYRGQWFGGGFVFQSYSLEDDLTYCLNNN